MNANNKCIAIFIVLWISLPAVGAAKIHYVKEGGMGDGSSWTNASGDLQFVIDQTETGDKIFIAAGVYTPAEGKAFVIGGKYLMIYGAFPANEMSATTSPAVPDTTNNKTILRGNGNRVIHAHFESTGSDGKRDDSLIMEGCRIEGGSFAGFGGGIYIKEGTISYCTIAGNTSTNNQGGGIWFQRLTLKNSIVSGNTAGLNGGGLYSYVRATISDCIITHNTALAGGGIYSGNRINMDNTRLEYNKTVGTSGGGGGGIYAQGSGDPSTITGCIISNNETTHQAGGVYIGKRTTMTNCTVSSNKSLYDGGGIKAAKSSTKAAEHVYIIGCVFENNEVTAGNGGGVALEKSTMLNCLIVNNKASGSGGGVRLTGDSSGEGINSYVYNTTIVNNTAGNGGGISANNGGMFQNCIIWNNKAGSNPGDVSGGKGTYTLYREATATNGNINSNPLFINLDNGDFRLSAGSPAIDAGLAVTTQQAGITVLSTDLAGAVRINGAAVDMGAYEYSPSTSVDWVENTRHKVWSHGKTLSIKTEKAGELSLYSVSGTLYFRQAVTEGWTSISHLPVGIYIIELNNRTHKAVIK
jgi:hypothetical protein